MQAEHIKPLTSLRFFAAAWVALYSYWPKLAGVGAAPGLIAHGYLGVDLFFILSGFILCHVYLPALEGGRFRYRTFLWARLARIYPLHLVAMAGIGLLGAAALLAGREIDPNVLAAGAVLPNLLLVHAWGFAPVSGWNHPSWSISAEWFAYLAFPLFALLAMRLRARPRMAVIAALLFLFALGAAFERLAGFPLTEATFRWGALRIVPCFAYGCALYLLWRSGAVQSRTWAGLGAAFLGAALLVGAQLGAAPSVLIALAGGLILCLALLSSAGSSALSSPILVYLGEISYAVYMICIPWELLFTNAAAVVFHLQDKQLPLWLWMIFLLSLVPLAALAHHLVERPARERLKAWPRMFGKRGLKTTAA